MLFQTLSDVKGERHSYTFFPTWHIFIYFQPNASQLLYCLRLNEDVLCLNQCATVSVLNRCHHPQFSHISPLLPCLPASRSSAQARMRHTPGVATRRRKVMSILTAKVFDPTPVSQPISRKTSKPMASVDLIRHLISRWRIWIAEERENCFTQHLLRQLSFRHARF